jgi:hypothetical protein
MRAGPATSGVACVVALGVLLLLVPVPRPAGPTAPGAYPRTLNLAPAGAAPSLEVDPPTWQMTGGNSTTVLATWVGEPPGCGLSPLWYHWSLPAPPDSGQLNATSGPQVTFVGDGASPGTTAIAVEGAALLECAGDAEPLVANASTTVTVVANLELANISIEPGPLAPGQSANLSASISGGDPPYSIEVDWDDGSSSAIALAAAGRFTSAHAFVETGQYAPSITATDAGGLTAHATDPTTIDVNAGTAIALSVDRTTTDVGVPVVWNATVEREPPWFVTNPECNGLPSDLFASLDPMFGTCTFSVPGRAIISVGTWPVFNSNDVSAWTAVSVVAPPSVSVTLPDDTTEVGLPGYLVAHVEGGVPPLTLTCAGPNPVSPAQFELLGDGTVAVPVDPSEVGQLDYTIQVEDSEGVDSAPVLATLLVEPALNGSFEDGRTVNATGANLSLAGSITSGVGPFVWSIVPSVPGSGPLAAAGVLEGPGAVGWSATYRLEGSVTVRLLVADSAGSVLEEVRVMPAIPPLAVAVAVPTNGTLSPGTVALSVGIAGGLPPFNVTAESTTGSLGSLSVATDGTVVWRLDTGATGPLPVSITVRDSADGAAWANTTVSIPVAPPSTGSSTPTPLAWEVAAAAVLAGVVVIAVLWRRRKRPAVPSAPVDPTAVLRSILSPADGAERTTVELLAEQEGVPLEIARSTLDRLIAERAVRSEIDGDGIEVLSWTHDAAP